MKVATIALLCYVVSRTEGSTNFSNHGQAIIIHTDIMSDVDDVGALALANVLSNCRLADLRGIAIKTNSMYSALAANVSCSFLLPQST